MKFIHYTNKDFESQFESDLRAYYKEVRAILPNLPNDIDIYFKSDGIIQGMSTGGFAYSPKIISIAISPNATNLEDIRSELKSMIFHEAYHIAHNFTGETGPFSLVEIAIQEGAATLFEQKYTNSKSSKLYGDYKLHSITSLKKWLEQIKKVKNFNKMSEKNYNSIAFYDKADNIRWKLYKTGTWLVSEYISKNNVDIENFSNEDVNLLMNSLEADIEK